MASTSAGRAVLWLSLDPVNGTLVPYPPPINQLIETAYKRFEREAQQEDIALGSSFHQATIHFSLRDGRHFQTTPRIDHGPRFGVKISGYRQVRRMEIDPAQTCVVLHTATHNGFPNGEWRIVEEEASMKTTSWEVKQDFLLSMGSELQRDFVSVWQWCKQNVEQLHGVHVTHAPDSAWGIYMRDTNAAIEAAFVAGDSSLDILLGVHRVTVELGSRGGVGVQKDQSGRRQRFVRRLLVSQEERDRMYSESAQALEVDELCALCLEPFPETLAWPVLHLQCRHVFHACCCQTLKEKRMPCPLCRREIEWNALVADTYTSRSS
mmetsp:Transcript_33425/g.74975  ORF Transcript_33425/g.74975 Transcript_33425/m.74975 type:complete len:322 (+) Transcript_33425:1-966(+)